MVSEKVKASFENAGKLDLKNIEVPVEAYFVIQSKGAARFMQHTEAPALKLDKAEAGSLAVTMFKSLSSDEEQGYFCEGFLKTSCLHYQDIISFLLFRVLLVSPIEKRLNLQKKLGPN